MKTGQASTTNHKTITEGIKARFELATFKRPTVRGQRKWFNVAKRKAMVRLIELDYAQTESKHCLVLTEQGQRKYLKTAMMSRQEAYRRNTGPLKASGFQWCVVDNQFRLPVNNKTKLQS